MSFLSQYWERPQQLWIRKVLFQIHLWLGVAIGIYVIAVGLTGSILVFKEEAVASLVPKAAHQVDENAQRVTIQTVIDKLGARYPKDRLFLVSYPSETTREFQAIAMRRAPGGGAKMMMASDPVTGDVVGDVNLTDSWLGFVHNLHISLLTGPVGFIANGVGAILLLLISATGLFLWWPGVRSWIRAFTVDFRRNWKRVNFDLHNTVGFYTLVLVSFWSISTVYFVWEDQFTAAVNRISPVTRPDPHATPFSVAPAKPGAARANVDSLVAVALAMVPGTRAHAVSPGQIEKQPLVVFLSQAGAVEDPAEIPMDATRVYFDPFTGRHLGTQPAPVNRTIGDWVIWSMVPLHFGNKWGFIVKVVWAILGLSLPVLVITGVLMWWNRSLGKKWKRIRTGRPSGRRAVPASVLNHAERETVAPER